MSLSTQIGNDAEIFIENILKTFSNISDVKRDTYCGRYDITFITKKDNLLRGVQIKRLGRKPLVNTYGSSKIHDYASDTFIICINIEDKIAVIFKAKDNENNAKSFAVNITNCNTKYFKFIVTWNNLEHKLKEVCENTIIISSNIYSPDTTIEMSMINRLSESLKSFNLSFVPNNSADDRHDGFINGYKIQLKFISNRRLGKNYYCVSSHSIFKQGDADFYIIELGPYINNFMILSEQLLISKGIIKTEQQEGKIAFCVFDYEYKQNKILTKTARVIGNWSCDNSLWFNKNSAKLPFQNTTSLEKVFARLIISDDESKVILNIVD
jgi:hypothetical protein